MMYRLGSPLSMSMAMMVGIQTSVIPKSGCLRISSIGPPTIAPVKTSFSIGCILRNWLRKSPTVSTPAITAICAG